MKRWVGKKGRTLKIGDQTYQGEVVKSNQGYEFLTEEGYTFSLPRKNYPRVIACGNALVQVNSYTEIGKVLSKYPVTKF